MPSTAANEIRLLVPSHYAEVPAESRRLLTICPREQKQDGPSKPLEARKGYRTTTLNPPRREMAKIIIREGIRRDEL